MVLLDSDMYQGLCCITAFMKVHIGLWISSMVMLHYDYVYKFIFLDCDINKIMVLQGLGLVMFATSLFLAFWNWWRFILEYAICPWVCCIMVMFIHVFYWIVRFCNSWVYLCLQWFCCISTYIKCYLVLWHSWRSILHCESFAWLRWIMVMFVNCFCWIMRFFWNGFVGFQHASSVMLHYDIYEGSSFGSRLSSIVMFHYGYVYKLVFLG